MSRNSIVPISGHATGQRFHTIKLPLIHGCLPKQGGPVATRISSIWASEASAKKSARRSAAMTKGLGSNTSTSHQPKKVPVTRFVVVGSEDRVMNHASFERADEGSVVAAALVRGGGPE